MFIIKYEKEVYAAFRIIAGFLFLWHGSQKIFNYPPSGIQGIPLYIILIGGSVEFFGGILVMIGLFTRWAAFFSSGEMAYAYWSVHGLKAVLPLVNQGEMAILYCFIFLYIAAKGSGYFGFDYYIGKLKKNEV